MASGCTTNGGSASILFQKKIPDTQVKYTGPAFPQFNICTGDSLDEIEAVVLNKIVEFSQGKGIDLAYIDLTQCDCFKDKVGCCGKESCQTLECVLQAYLDCMCELYADVQVLITKMEELYDGPYDTSCLTGVTSSSKLPDIIKAMIVQICANKSNIASLTTLVNTLSTSLPSTIRNEVLNMIQSCNTSVLKSGSGATATITINGIPPVGSIIPMAQSGASNFDLNGVGKPNTTACGWSLADGRNSTTNMMGLFPIGTTDMGGTAPISGRSFPVSSSGGEYSHTLSASESGTGSHTHTIDEHGGHSHTMSVNLDGASGGANSNYMKFDTTSFTNTLDGQADVGNIKAKIRKNLTGITINPGGGSAASEAHENTPPYRALYFIQRMF